MTSPRTLRVLPMTLIEIITAMSILIVIMYIVTQAFHSTQLIWRKTQQNTELYEQARLIMDIVTRDLQGMRANDLPGDDINFTLDPSEMPNPANTTWLMAFVTTSGIGAMDGDTDPMMEVGYYYTVDADGADTRLWRAMTPISADASWDFHNTHASTWANSWDGTKTALLATGIHTISMAAYDSDGNSINDATDDTNTLPARVTLNLELTSGTDASIRHFAKTVYLTTGR